jgi:L-lactate dehydrogenase complex protein LldG
MSKTDILQSIRKHKFVYPSVSTDFNVKPAVLSFAEQVDLFKKNLQAAGAAIVELSEKESDNYIAENFPNVLDFTNPETCAKFTATTSLEKLDKTELVLFSGNIGVAENGAIWLEDKDLPNRILPFITQSLVLKICTKNIVSNMQEAYRRIALKGLGFGVFISGPSKTADIEQSLVYGAHGAKELTVIIIPATP